MAETVEHQLPQDAKDMLHSTDSAIHAVAEDVKSIGDELDYSKVTMEQLVKEVRNLRSDNQVIRYEVKKLSQRLDEFVSTKSKIVYARYAFPKIDILKWLRVK